MKSPLVGILAFQGDFALHTKVFKRLKCKVQLLKSPLQLDEVDCLVIPGGESSVIARFIEKTDMTEPLRDFAREKPIWGTCAGMILLAREIINDNRFQPLNLIDIAVERNGFGRQYESFIGQGEIDGIKEPLEMVFIRAPRIVSLGKDVTVLGRWRDEVTVVRQGNMLATSFHPELTGSPAVQTLFLSMVEQRSVRHSK